MKHKKKITDAVLSANRANSKLSTGPRTDEGKAKSCKNSVRHGILARKVAFGTHKERRAYRRIKRAWKQYFHPHGTLERFLVDEIALISLKLGVVEGFEMQELLRREDSPGEIESVFHGHLKLPVSGWDLPLDRGWDCERMVVRAVAGDDHRNASGTKGPLVFQNQVVPVVDSSRNSQDRHGSHLEVQAVLGTSLNTFIRYSTALKRDFYRAIEKLIALQKERRERERSEQTADGMECQRVPRDTWAG